MIETMRSNLNGFKGREIGQFKGLIVSECVTANLNGYEFWTVQYSANTIGSFVIVKIIFRLDESETLLFNRYTFQFIQSIQLERASTAEAVVSYEDVFQ